MNLKIKPGLIISSEDLQWNFSRSSGPGGQNINKTNTRAEVIFNVENSKALSPYQKFRHINLPW